MESLRFTFAETLKAADTPAQNSQSDLQFPQFSKLPAEVRIAVWETILPSAEEEPPAVFCQRHSVTWTDSNGVLGQPDASDLVPIRMTTTCAALLHVNRESRHTVLRWADSLGYKLCFRALSFDFDQYDDFEADEEHERDIPVQGPIFTRGWDPSKDILNVFWTADDYGIPDEWADEYLEGEKLENVQHLAFAVDDMEYCLRSRWFYQLLIATPDLKSISFDNDTLMEGDGETFHVRFLETVDVGDPWLTTGSNSNSWPRRRHSSEIYTRWEAAPCDAQVAEDFQYLRFKQELLQGYRDPENWPPKEDEEDDSNSDGSRTSADEREAFERLPPWVWNREKGEFAFELRAPFEMVERRGYDDVRGGLVVNCDDHYNTQ